MIRDERCVTIITRDSVRAAECYEILMAVELPGKLAVARHAWIEKRDPAPVKRWRTFAAHRLQRPIRAGTERNDATAQVDDTAGNPVRRGDGGRRCVRTTRSKLAGRARRVGEAREGVP